MRQRNRRGGDDPQPARRRRAPIASSPPRRDDRSVAHSTLDLRGVRCPLNWAKAKVHLEGLPRGAVIELLVDDPQAARDIPRAAEASGHLVIAVTATDDGACITIEV